MAELHELSREKGESVVGAGSPTTKVCSKCNQHKTLEHFYKQASCKYGVRPDCKECNSKKGREYHHSHKDSVRITSAKYRSENRDRLNARSRDYSFENRDAIRARQAADRINNVEKHLLNSALKRARSKNLPFNLDQSDIIVPEICPVLDIPIKKGTGKVSGNSPTLDRIKPELGYVKGNVVVISHKANSIKSNATSDEILKVGNWLANLGY